ncbi:MAG: hypothetical protein HZA32_02160 [Opitutae bacterium]|nr:hypothetical protein [Opitutae bacterium]
MSSGASPSSGPDYYVRGINDAEARGPFTVEQLASLAEAGQVTVDTYYYDPATEQWLTFGSNESLKSAIWPEKKKLGFKEKEFKAVNKADEKSPAITVQQFLDAAEGKTDDTKGKKDKSLDMMKAAMWGTKGAAIIMFVSAVALMLPGLEALTAMDFGKLLDKPLVFLGALDLVLGLLLLLGVISLYPFVRFRAVFGFGFLGFILWTQGEPVAIAALAAGSAGLYFSTIFLSYIPLGVALLAGIGGMAALAGMNLF